MDSLLNLLNKSSEFLTAKGVPQARLDAELIFAHTLNCKRLDLYLQFERPITPSEADLLRPLIVRRSKREPLQYILSSTEFFGLTLKCDSRGLIPRPETEELVEHLVESYKSDSPSEILDLGTGSGCLGLALAKAFPEAKVTLVDQSADALKLAEENANSNGLSERTIMIQSDWLSMLHGKKFDLIVSNPPYLTEAEWESAEPEVSDHEPKAALVGGGDDGGDDLRRIITEAPDFLNAGGMLGMETGINQHSSLKETASVTGLSDFRSENDLSGRPRFVFARR
ncbi:peptide chain release factor N(5)-glutamine methyltransferase [Rubellicoccus peritrichatus]|uniref:Release factor glutamine methyltransferase n=1 Tax=Rubellicoccus peritrichatus TaxID=3080537 RepID=A0AAQ3QVZ2_9BACT|nr:peptide chain release factor N(5)-glutamine methyltransferase [Puniceicoccus sp. CR14]WOO41400.1 peptide chain release factor N(5)-glutamine methyltransferase [Puniceicoccus sp. CR14]